jgi:hypothetical protein
MSIPICPLYNGDHTSATVRLFDLVMLGTGSAGSKSVNVWRFRSCINDAVKFETRRGPSVRRAISGSTSFTQILIGQSKPFISG